MRKRKYRIRPAPNTEGKWLAEYSYLGLFWRSIERGFCYDFLASSPPIEYSIKAKAAAVINRDIARRKEIAKHQAKGSERYP